MRDELREVEDDRGETVNQHNSAIAEATAGQGRYVVPFSLSREEEAVAMELARSQLANLMVECAAPSFEESTDESWTQIKSKKKSTGVTLWEKREKAKKKKRGSMSIGLDRYATAADDNGRVMYSVRSTTTVNAPLDTVLKILDASTATAHRSFTRIIYGNLVADTSVLFHSSTPSTDFLADREHDSFDTLAVRWLVCRCSNPMVSDCDFCLQEYTKRHSIDELAMNCDHYSNNKVGDDDGTYEGLHPVGEMPAAYKLFRSMETRHCPELLESHRVVRCKVPLGGFLLYPTDSSEQTDVVFYMSIAQDAGGDRSNRSGSAALHDPMLTHCSDRQFRALQNVARQMALQIGHLDNAVESYKLSAHLESLRTLQWVRNAERAECVVCCRRFNQLTRRRHHCRLCGEVICRECSVKKDVDLPTFGLTALRICTSCNEKHSSSRSKASALDVSASPKKPRRCRAPLPTNHSTEKAKLEQVTTAPISELPLRRRSNTQGEDKAAKIMEEMQRERRFVAPLSRKALDQASSCPKPASSPAVDRRYFANKWGGAKAMPTAQPAAPGAPMVISSPIGIHRSSSETFSASPHHQPPRPKDRARPQLNDSEDEDKFETYADSKWDSPTTRARPIYAMKNGVLDSATGNQRSSASTANVSPVDGITRNQPQDRALIHRSFETLKQYEDIFLKLCENSASVRRSRFVALTLFTRTDKNQQDETEAVHYLKVKSSDKLMKTAANMRCCDPVLQLNKPIATRNTWTVKGKSAVHPSGFDFRQLPIVLGPQQARFYAGVPLTDAKNRYRYGAVAVFDATIKPGEDDDLPMKKTLQALQVCARETVMAADERRKELELRSFLQAPLIQLRQSEPALNISMDTSQSSPHWHDIESLDGDSDDDDDDETQRRHEYELRHARTKSGPEFHDSGSSSVSKARVEYFRNKMQELVQQAQDTQAQMVENTFVMERHGVPIV